MHKTPEIARLIHENLWTVLSFAYGQPQIGKVLSDHFKGEWRYLRETVYQLAEIKADRALLEMATQLRVLDDAEELTARFRELDRPALGKVIQANGTETELHFRDMTNKVMHGVHFNWHLDVDEPYVLITSKDPDRWQSAKLDLVSLMLYVGDLVY